MTIEQTQSGRPGVEAGRGPSAVAGLLAAMVALGLAELVAGLLASAPSLVYAVGNTVIDAVPGWLEGHAIALLGQADKPALIVGTVVLSALAGAGPGVLGRRWFWLAVAGFAAFGVIGVLAALAYQDAQVGASVATALLGTAAGVAALFMLLRAARARAEAGRQGDAEGGDRRIFLRLAGVQPAGTQVVGRAVDGFTAGFPTEIARTVPDALVAVGMNGEPLPSVHGFPARLVVPGLYGTYRRRNGCRRSC